MKTQDRIFEDLVLVQDSEHLKYGTDALLLSAFVKGNKNARALDLGCGNGVIPLALLHTNKAMSAVGVEIQESSAELSLESAQLNGLSARFSVIHGDFTSELPLEAGSFDYATSNPPYMKADSGRSCKSDHKTMARHEISCDIFSVCKAAARYVKFGGDFYVVYRPDRISDLFAALRENRFEPKTVTFVCARPSLPPCLILVSAKLGAMPGGCKVTPTFFIADEDGKETQAMKDLYQARSMKL